MRSVARSYLVAVGLVAALYFALPTASQAVVYDGIGVSAAVAMLVGARWHRPVQVSAWVMLALGVAMLAGGDVVFGTEQSVPSPADMLYISAYPLLALGLAGLAPWRVARRPGASLLAALAVAATVGAVSFVFLVVPAGDVDGVTLASRVVALGYPAMDVGLLALLVRAAAADGFRQPHHRLLGAALLCTLVADTGYALQDFGTAYSVGGLLDALWLVQYACFGAAALHPSLRTRFAPRVTPVPAASVPVARAPRRGTTLVVDTSVVLRFEVVAMWAGRLLIALSAATLLLSAKWLSGEIVALAGAYGITGCLMLVAGAARAWQS
jgi:hypothetical protein